MKKTVFKALLPFAVSLPVLAALPEGHPRRIFRRRLLWPARHLRIR